MDKKKILYMTPEQAQEVDPSLIDSVTLTTGSIVKIINQESNSEFKEEICEKCGLPKSVNETVQENVFRGENKEIKVEAESTEEKKEVLRGPNGMPLLGDILSGNNNIAQQNQQNINPQQPPSTLPVNPIPQPKVQPPKPAVIIPPKQITPQPKGPLNPTVRPFIPPKPRIIPPKVIPPKQPVVPPKVIMPIENRRIKSNLILHPGKTNYPKVPPHPVVFRNRKIDNKEEVLCPNCANNEILCPNCSNEVLCPNCANEVLLCPECSKKEEVLCPDCIKKEEKEKEKEKEEEKNKNKNKNKTKENETKNKLKETPKNKPYERKEENKNKKDYKKENKKENKNEQKGGKGKDVNFDNYKYHEVNAKTSKNKKSLVIVKKEGVVIASHDE